MFSLIHARINGWVNTGDAGDLKRHHAHYDAGEMLWLKRGIHERAWLAHQCTFGEKIALVSMSHFQVIKILHRLQMIIDIVEFA